jgi:hypothetical protein
MDSSSYRDPERHTSVSQVGNQDGLTAQRFQKDFLPTLPDGPPEEPGAINDAVLDCWRAFCLDGMSGSTTFVLLRSASE